MFLPKMILVPVDFSTHSDETLTVSADLAARFDAELCLVHVVPAIPELPAAVSVFKEGEYEQKMQADAAAHLKQIAEGLTREGIATKSQIGIANEAGMEILRLAESNHADLIVIATHGMTGWRRIAFGSVAEKVIQQAACPVLVFRVQPKEAPAGDATTS